MTSLRTEPVAITAAIRAVLLIVTTLGLVRFTEEDTESILLAVGAIYVALEAVISAWQRSKVSPSSATAERVQQVVMADTGNKNIAHRAAQTVRTGELPGSSHGSGR